MTEPLYPGVEEFLKTNSAAVLKVGYAKDHGFLASFVVKKTNEKVGPNSRFCQTVDDTVTSLDRRLRGMEEF